MKLPLIYREQQAIGQGCLNEEKHPSCHVRGIFPTHIVAAHGCVVKDEAGKEYIDFISGLGTNLLGYGNETINRAVQGAMAMGFNHSLPTQFEVLAAEKLKEILPWVERVKFTKTEQEALELAQVIGRSKSPPVTINPMAYADQSLQAVVAEYAKQNVVIFDEMTSGFRHLKFTKAKYLNIRPDLICVGGAMANGMPLAAVAGSAALMDRDYSFNSSRTAGEVLSLAAASATMQLLLSKKYDVDRLWDAATEFARKFNELARGYIALLGNPACTFFSGNATHQAIFRQEASKAGLLFGPEVYYNFEHMRPEIEDRVIGTLRGVFKKIADGRAHLEGELPRG